MAVYTGNQEARNLPTISESFIFVSFAISGCFKLEHACGLTSRLFTKTNARRGLDFTREECEREKIAYLVS